jgi:hypothetical protein
MNIIGHQRSLHKKPFVKNEKLLFEAIFDRSVRQGLHDAKRTRG